MNHQDAKFCATTDNFNARRRRKPASQIKPFGVVEKSRKHVQRHAKVRFKANQDAHCILDREEQAHHSCSSYATIGPKSSFGRLTEALVNISVAVRSSSLAAYTTAAAEKNSSKKLFESKGDAQVCATAGRLHAKGMGNAAQREQYASCNLQHVSTSSMAGTLNGQLGPSATA